MATCDFDNLATGAQIGKTAHEIKVTVTRATSDGELKLQLTDMTGPATFDPSPAEYTVLAGDGSVPYTFKITHTGTQLPEDDEVTVKLVQGTEVLDSDVASLVDVVETPGIGIGTINFPFVINEANPALPNISGTYTPPPGREESVLIEIAKKKGHKDKKRYRALVLKSARWYERDKNGVTEYVWDAVLPPVGGNDKLYVRVYLINKNARAIATATQRIR